MGVPRAGRQGSGPATAPSGLSRPEPSSRPRGDGTSAPSRHPGAQWERPGQQRAAPGGRAELHLLRLREQDARGQKGGSWGREEEGGEGRGLPQLWPWSFRPLTRGPLLLRSARVSRPSHGTAACIVVCGEGVGSREPCSGASALELWGVGGGESGGSRYTFAHHQAWSAPLHVSKVGEAWHHLCRCQLPSSRLFLMPSPLLSPYSCSLLC